MKDIKHLILELIPDKKERQGDLIVRKDIIDSLNDIDKYSIEEELFKILGYDFDLLIIETLVYLKSKKIAPLLLDKLYNSELSDSVKIMFVSYLFKLKEETKEIEDIAYNSFVNLKNKKYELIFLFYYISEIKSKRIIELIEEYSKSKDLLLSHNAKKALSI